MSFYVSSWGGSTRVSVGLKKEEEPFSVPSEVVAWSYRQFHLFGLLYRPGASLDMGVTVPTHEGETGTLYPTLPPRKRWQLMVEWEISQQPHVAL